MVRVYVGSFKDGDMARNDHDALFAKDRQVLMDKLHELPKACGIRKVNEMVKRIRLSTVNVCVLGYLRSQMPYLWGKRATQDKLVDDLANVFETVRRKYDLAKGDFPNVEEFQAVLRHSDFDTFPSASRDVLVSLQDMLLVEIPKILEHVHGISSFDPNGSVEGRGDDEDEATTQNQLQFIKIDGHQAEAPPLAIIVTAVIIVLVGIAIALYLASDAEGHKTLLGLIDQVQQGLQPKQA